MAGEEVEIRCRVPDNCPQLRPRVGWEGIEELPEASERELHEDAAGAATILALLRFRPRREDGGRRLSCKVTFTNSTLAFEATVALDVQCELGSRDLGAPHPQILGSPPDIWGPWGGYWGGSRSPYSQMSGFSSQVHGWGTSASPQCVGLGIGVHLGAPQIFGSPGEVMGGVVLGPTGSRHPPRLWVGVLGHPTPRCLGSPHQVHGWGTSVSPPMPGVGD